MYYKQRGECERNHRSRSEYGASGVERSKVNKAEVTD